MNTQTILLILGGFLTILKGKEIWAFLDSLFKAIIDYLKHKTDIKYKDIEIQRLKDENQQYKDDLIKKDKKIKSLENSKLRLTKLIKQ